MSRSSLVWAWLTRELSIRLRATRVTRIDLYDYFVHTEPGTRHVRVRTTRGMYTLARIPGRLQEVPGTKSVLPSVTGVAPIVESPVSLLSALRGENELYVQPRVMDNLVQRNIAKGYELTFDVRRRMPYAYRGRDMTDRGVVLAIYLY